MIGNTTRRTAWAALALVGCVAVACGDDTGTGGTPSTGGNGGEASTGGNGGAAGGGVFGGGGSGGNPTQGGGGSGEGGSGGGMPAEPGPPGNALVSAGDYVTSEQYKLVFTMGQSTQNQSKMTSPHYRLQGGLIGATGSLP